MSGRIMSRYELTCDSCRRTLGEGGEFGNSMECRAAAYSAGWRFPGKITSAGQPAKRECSDVCPDCLSTFTPQLTASAREKMGTTAATTEGLPVSD